MKKFFKQQGSITTITGNMFGGKTTQLIQMVNDIMKESSDKEIPVSICCFKHSIDDRYENDKIATHDGLSIPAIPVNSLEKLSAIVKEKNPDVVVIDEVQFFDEKAGNNYIVIDFLRNLVKTKQIIVSGLSKDFRGMPFGPIGDILALSDNIIIKNSVCVVCGDEATMSQRLVNGAPASWYQNTVAVGAAMETINHETYEPRCRNCHCVSEEPVSTLNTVSY